MKKYLVVTANNGSRWGFPVEQIARSRADYYKDEFGGSVERSLAEDTVPLFEAHPGEVSDWAFNNMNASDFTGVQLLASPPPIDLDDMWSDHADSEVSDD